MKLTLNDLEIEVDETIGSHISSLQAEIEAQRVRAEQAEKLAAELPSKIKTRLALETEARKYLSNTDLDKLSDRQVREAVVNKLQKNVDLKDKSDDYVVASFDVAVANAGKLSPVHSARQAANQSEAKPQSLHDYYVGLGTKALRS